MTAIPISRAALEPVLGPLAGTALAAGDGVLARIWLTGPGDRCAGCPQRAHCPDQRRCLHLVASAGLTTRLDGPFRRFPIGSTEVGRVPLTGVPHLAAGDLATAGLAEPTWLATHRVRGFVAVPLAYGGEAIGVLAVFTRRAPDPGMRDLLVAIAGLGALALGSVRAFRELATERNRSVGRAARRRPATAPAPADPLRPLAVSEREIIERVLAHTAGKVSGRDGAAAVLHLKPTTLFSRMKKLGIDRRAIAVRRA